MYYEEESVGLTIFKSLFLSLLFFLSFRSGKQAAIKEAEEKKQKEDIEYLKWRLNNRN
jgi:hypothetical protein